MIECDTVFCAKASGDIGGGSQGAGILGTTTFKTPLAGFGAIVNCGQPPPPPPPPPPPAEQSLDLKPKSLISEPQPLEAVISNTAVWFIDHK